MLKRFAKDPVGTLVGIALGLVVLGYALGFLIAVLEPYFGVIKLLLMCVVVVLVAHGINKRVKAVQSRRR